MIERSLYARMTVALLALVGFFDASYLLVSHFRTDVAMTCPVTGDGCTQVRDSIWSVIPPGEQGIPIALIGVCGYVVVCVLSMVALQRDRLGGMSIPLGLVALSSVGVAFCIYLVSLQLFVIHAICFWCMVSSVLMPTIWILTLYDWRMWQRYSTDQVLETVAGVSHQA